MCCRRRRWATVEQVDLGARHSVRQVRGEAKSSFTFDIIRWIAGVAEILLAVSNAPACRRHDREQLRSHATWLLGTLTWIPDDAQAVRFVESSKVTEVLFESALDAHERGLDEVAKRVNEFLLSWTYTGGKHQVGWGILERGLCASAVIASKLGVEQELVFSVRARSDKLTVDPNVRLRAADAIREKAEGIGYGRYPSSSIEHALSQADADSLRPLLESIADILSDIVPPASK